MRHRSEAGPEAVGRRRGMAADGGAERWMREALAEAQQAIEHDEVPVGCVFVSAAGAEIGRGHNLTGRLKNGTQHAEMVALDAVFAEGGARAAAVAGSTLYVTCEPCIMCGAALARVGVRRVVFGCHNERFGGCGSLLSLHAEDAAAVPGADPAGYEIQAGVLADDAVALFKTFYARANKSAPQPRKRKQPAG